MFAMKRLFVLALALLLCLPLSACGGGGASGGGASQEHAQGTVATEVFTMAVADGWTVVNSGRTFVELENGSAYFAVSFNQMGFAPPPENIPLLSYQIGGHSWNGFISAEDGDLHVIKAQFSEIPDSYCLVHTRGVTPDAPDVAKMIESITIVNPDADLPII